MIEVRPEGHKDGVGSDITLNKLDMRSKFGYKSLSAMFRLLKFNIIKF